MFVLMCVISGASFFFAFPDQTKTVVMDGLTYFRVETGFQPLALLGLLLLIPLFAWYSYTYVIECDPSYTGIDLARKNIKPFV